MRRQNDDDLLADLREEVEEALPLFGVEAGRRLVDNHQPGIAQQRLRDAESLAHPTGEPGDGLAAHIPQVDLAQQVLDHVAALSAGGIAFEHSQVRQQIPCRDTRVDAKILWEVTQLAAEASRVGQDVETIERQLSRLGNLEGGNAAHQCAFACAVGPQQAEHAGGQFQ